MSSAVSAGGVRLPTPSVFTRTVMLGIVGSLSMYLASWENADRVRDNYLDKQRDPVDSFDFIIVGGGTAGSILANRLSEKYKTLLLEAGGEAHPFTSIPLFANYLLNYPQLDWRHVTMPQSQAFRGSIQNRASISQGRGLGGSSNLDYMMYLRGHPLDYDNWADITEDSSWSYSAVSEHFKSFEHYSGRWAAENHEVTGDLLVRQPSFIGLGEPFCQAAEQNGYKQTNLNAEFNEGCDVLTYPTRRGYRNSAYDAFLKKHKDRSNLVIQKFAHVNKILFRGNDTTAYAVQYDRHGRSRIAYAKKEVIVTAGAIQTPKLLMLSGIGIKSDLEALGLPVISNLPVGKNLQDHLSVYLGPFFIDRGRAVDIDRDVSTSSVFSLAKDMGPLTTTGFQSAAVIASGLEKLHGTRSWPDLQLTMHGISHHSTSDVDFAHQYQLKKDLIDKYFEHSKGHDSFSVVVTGGRPRSTGYVKLLNRNPYAPLIINPNYFDKIYDVVVMVDGVKKALRIVENSTSLYHDLHARFTLQVLPGCEKFKFRSDAYLECFVRTMSVSLGNVAGTAPMGTVVSSTLEVKGVKGLRVMDASVMPSIVSTSCGAAVMMIAEKGAKMILKKWEVDASEVGVESQTIPNKIATRGTLEDSNNAVFDQIKEKANQIKLSLDSSKVLIDTLKTFAVPDTDNKTESILLGPDQSFSLDDLEKLTKGVNNIAAMLDPISAASSHNFYTGSFNLGNETRVPSASASALTAMMSLAPNLKSQLGEIFPGVESEIPIVSRSKPTTKSTTTTTTTRKPLLENFQLNDRESIKQLQDKISAKIQELKKSLKNANVTRTTVKASTPVKSTTVNSTTLRNGNTKGSQRKVQRQSKNVTVSVITAKTPVSTNKTKETTTTTTTSTTMAPAATSSKTPKLTFTDFQHVLSFSSTPSKRVTPAPTTQRSTVAPRPIYAKPTSIPTTAFTFTLPEPVRITTPPSQTFKNLEALAQIQHETLAKLKGKIQQPRPLPYHQHATYPQNPPPSSSISPALEILPPPLRGRFPPPPFYQNGVPPPQYMHSVYEQMQMLHRPLPVGGQHLLNRPTPPPGFDPSDLKDAVGSIMNAKYIYPTVNPFLGMLSQPPKKEQRPESSTILKAMELRANVDKLLNMPYKITRPSPIAITHRPTPPIFSPQNNQPPHPPMFSSPINQPPPPPPLHLAEDAGILAPIKDVLEPITSFMKAPLKLLPNPFKQETTTESSASTAGYLTSGIFSGLFQHRIGPLSQELVEDQPVYYADDDALSSQKPLTDIVPRFIMNHSNSTKLTDDEIFLIALSNATNGLPKPFVLQPNKAFASSTSASGKPDEKQKLLDESISDILKHLKNHHFTNAATSSPSPNDADSDSEDDDTGEGVVGTSTTGSSIRGNSPNEIKIGYSRATALSVTPNSKFNPPIEFHKSSWAKEPLIPSKSLHFRIKIVKNL